MTRKETFSSPINIFLQLNGETASQQKPVRLTLLGCLDPGIQRIPTPTLFNKRSESPEKNLISKLRTVDNNFLLLVLQSVFLMALGGFRLWDSRLRKIFFLQN